MDDRPNSERMPRLDESFVAGAARREPSHHEREHFWAELDQPGGRRPRRTRQVVGVVITVLVLIVAYGSQYLPFGHSSLRGLSPEGPASCASTVYPAGAQYRFEQCWQGQPVAWPRCSTLTVAVNPADAPSSWQSDVSVALGQLGQATGLRFRPTVRGAGDITVEWTSTLLAPAGSERDKAGLTYFVSRSNLEGAQIATANIQVATRLSGGAGQSGELPVLLHEFGHAVGLGHYAGPEVMHPIDQGYGSYQNGDLAGLAKLYGPASCGLR